MSTLNEAAEMLKLIAGFWFWFISLEQLDQEVLGTVASLAKVIKDKEELLRVWNRRSKKKRKLDKMTDQDLPALCWKELIDFKSKTVQKSL